MESDFLYHSLVISLSADLVKKVMVSTEYRRSRWGKSLKTYSVFEIWKLKARVTQNRNVMPHNVL